MQIRFYYSIKIQKLFCWLKFSGNIFNSIIYTYIHIHIHTTNAIIERKMPDDLRMDDIKSKSFKFIKIVSVIFFFVISNLKYLFLF